MLELAAAGLGQGVDELGLRQGAGGPGLGPGVGDLCRLWLGGGHVRLTLKSTRLRLGGEELGLGLGAGGLPLAQVADVAQRPMTDGACKRAAPCQQACPRLFCLLDGPVAAVTAMGTSKCSVHTSACCCASAGHTVTSYMDVVELCLALPCVLPQIALDAISHRPGCLVGEESITCRSQRRVTGAAHSGCEHQAHKRVAGGRLHAARASATNHDVGLLCGNAISATRLHDGAWQPVYPCAKAPRT